MNNLSVYDTGIDLRRYRATGLALAKIRCMKCRRRFISFKNRVLCPRCKHNEVRENDR